MISVIICTFNRANLLKKVLQSLKEMSVSGGLEWELIIVDNNSKDNTRECVRQFQSNAQFTIRYILEERQGLSHARNRGVEESHGEIIAFTDDDVEVHPAWLFEMNEALERFNAMAVGGKIVPVWGFSKPDWYIGEGPLKMMNFIMEFDLGEEARIINATPFGANMAFQKAAFEKYGVFRSDLGRAGNNLFHGEDTEFGQRLLRGGEIIAYAPKAVVYHPVEPQRAEPNYAKAWYFMYGRSAIRRVGIPAVAPRYWGVPRYLLRELFLSCSRWLFSLTPSVRFHHKLQIYRVAGEIAEAREMAATTSSTTQPR